MSDAYHRPVFEIAARVRRDAGWLPVEMMKQLTFFGNDPRMVPFAGLNLHDDHTAWRRIALSKPFPLPVIEIEVVRVLTFPPRIIDAKIGQRNALCSMPVHYQPPAVVRAQNEWATNQRNGIRRDFVVFVTIRRIDAPDDT